MEKAKEFLLNNLIIIILSVFVIGLGGLSVYLYYLNESFNCPICEECEKEIAEQKMYVDIKGNVKNPGVYEVTSNNIVNDVINLAGGFTKNAYTKNINLSKKVTDELVIYVYSKSEYSNFHKKEEDDNQKNCSSNDYNIDNCLGSSSIISTGNEKNETNEKNENTNSSNNQENELVNINTATKEKLMTLNGIGESKAVSIIEYRENNGGFKSIEEIKNVSGIGEAAFEKIKSNITI